MALKDKKILIGISGSIAAYKTAILVRMLIKAGAQVKVVMTPAATSFISPITLSTLSKNQVSVHLTENDTWSNHVMLGRWADIMLMAPLSCNTLSKMAHGICDNLLMAVYLSATCPVAVAPAMDEDMWKHHSTKHNINKIQSFGNHLIPVETGELASGLFGEGRMAEPETMVAYLSSFFENKTQFLGKKILVTAGPTHEAIDKVRFIGNHSSGKMGIAIAKEFAERGADVHLVCGPVTETIPSNLTVHHVISAEQMYQQCVSLFPIVDLAVMSAAVADYTIENPVDVKIKKSTSDKLELTLVKTKDILKELGILKQPQQLLIGFSLETNDEEDNAIKKLNSKHADMMILNSLNDQGAGFGTDTNKITVYLKDGSKIPFDLKSKKEVASDIIDLIYKQIACEK